MFYHQKGFHCVWSRAITVPHVCFCFNTKLFYDYSSVEQFEIRDGDSSISSFTIIDCISYPSPFLCVFLYGTVNFTFKPCEELCWNFNGDCTTSADCFWWDGHFHYIIHEHEGSFRLISSSISSFKDLKFLSYNFLPYLARVDLKYFIFFKAPVKVAICLIFFSVCLLCVYRRATDFTYLLLYPDTLQKMFIIVGSF